MSRARSTRSQLRLCPHPIVHVVPVFAAACQVQVVGATGDKVWVRLAGFARVWCGQPPLRLVPVSSLVPS